MFLKRAFGSRAWHNPHRCASFVIDDPLLKKSYGFLNYARLLKEMDSTGFCSTIAFIPWNHRRTDAAAAQMFRTRSDRFQLCVHGCDHTAGEFSKTDVSELHGRVRLATWRMKDHEQRTGLPFDDVMVFPQGRFSSHSLAVLKTHNFLAAVNSSVKPQDAGNIHGLTLRDMLSPAVLKYSSFPLFGRRYPREIADFALDLFVGKPALLVEHHGYFKDGYKHITEFAAKLNALSPRLEWMGVGDAIKQTYLKRLTPTTTECRIFANRHCIQNTTSADTTVQILKTEANKTSIDGVVVNGAPCPYTVEDGSLRFHATVPAHGAVTVGIDYAPDQQYGQRTLQRSLSDGIKVYVRRHLSELRDNYLARNDKLLSLAYRVKNRRVSAHE